MVISVFTGGVIYILLDSNQCTSTSKHCYNQNKNLNTAYGNISFGFDMVTKLYAGETLASGFDTEEEGTGQATWRTPQHPSIAKRRES